MCEKNFFYIAQYKTHDIHTYISILNEIPNLFTLTGLIFGEINFHEINFAKAKIKIIAWTYFRRWSNFRDFAWINFRGRNLYLQKLVFSYLCLNKQKKLKDLDMKIVYVFPECIYSKYYPCDFRKSLLLLANHYHYFHHLNVRKGFIDPESNVSLQPKRSKSHKKENTTTKKHEQNNNAHNDFKSPRRKWGD